MTRHLAVQYPEYNVICFDKLDRVSSAANVGCLRSLPNFTFVQGDITSAGDVSRALAAHGVDCVVHFAASSHVQDSFADAASFTLNNVVGTQVLLDCVREHGSVRRLVHVSTDEVYGETNGCFLDEEHQFRPTNPYSASKAAAEMYVMAYAKSFKIPSIIVRSNNVYGPCQYPESMRLLFFSLSFFFLRLFCFLFLLVFFLPPFLAQHSTLYYLANIAVACQRSSPSSSSSYPRASRSPSRARA